MEQIKFQSKFSAYIAPLKNYDAIIGRDTLRKWQTTIHLNEDPNTQTLNENNHTENKTKEEGIEVYDPKTKTRMTLVYGVHKNQDQEDRTWSEKRLQEELQKTKELWLYEIYITDTTKTNTHEPIPKEVPNNKNINQTGGEPGNSMHPHSQYMAQE